MQIKRKLTIGVIALLAIGLIGAAGYAYWSVQQTLTANEIASGHMAITVNDFSTGTAATSLTVSGLMPGDSGSKQYTIESPTGNPNTDLWFSVDNVVDPGTLADNVQVAFLLQTTPDTAYWLLPSGPHAYDFTPGGPTLADQIADPSHYDDMRAFNAIMWSELPGYVNLPAGQSRHITAYYNLPVDCAADCHDCTVTFDMTFGLSQSHT